MDTAYYREKLGNRAGAIRDLEAAIPHANKHMTVYLRERVADLKTGRAD